MFAVRRCHQRLRCGSGKGAGASGGLQVNSEGAHTKGHGLRQIGEDCESESLLWPCILPRHGVFNKQPWYYVVATESLVCVVFAET